MPELPEVETIVRKYRPLLTRKRILGFTAHWPRQVSPSVAAVRRALPGRTITDVDRRGKQIVLALDDGSALLFHLKMSGRFEWQTACRNPPGHVRAVIRLTGTDALLFCDARKFGRIRHVPDPARALEALGPEPLDPGFNARALDRLLSQRRKRLKSLLLDQAFLAGLGNIYTDEALFAARLHPLRRADSLGWEEVKRLHQSMRMVLRKGIRHCGTSLDWIYPGGSMQDYLKVYGRRDQPCPRCARPIERILVAQRSTHLCPHCQPGR